MPTKLRNPACGLGGLKPVGLQAISFSTLPLVSDLLQEAMV